MTDSLDRIVAAAEWSDNEDEYEYEYSEEEVEDGYDDDENDFMEEDFPVPEPSLLKRSASESSTAISAASLTSWHSEAEGNDNRDSYILPLPTSKHGSEAIINFHQSTEATTEASSSWMALPVPDASLHAGHCHACLQENHVPISCQAAQTWRQELNKPRATLSVSPHLMQFFLDCHVKEFATAYRLTLAQAWTRLRWARWNPRLAALNAHGTTIIDVGGGLRAISAIHTIEEMGTITTTQNLPETCPICFESTNVALMGLGCGHEYCRSCWSQYLRINIQGPGVLTLSCPQPKCKTLVTTEFARSILGDPGTDIMGRYLLESFVQITPGLVCCPGPGCCQIIVKGRPNPTKNANLDGLDATQCDACQTLFCFHCGQAPHDMEPCLPPPMITAATIRKTEQAGGNPSTAQRQEKTKVCPGCRALIQRVYGCRRMVCRCGHVFCWSCFADMKDGYSHDCGAEDRMMDPTDDQVIDLDYLIEMLNRHDDVDSSYSYQAKALLEPVKQKMEEFVPHFNPFYSHHRSQRQAEARQDASMSEHVEAANHSLITARRLLKYSCVQAYNKRNEEAPTGGDASLELDHCVLAGLFEMYLEQLDRHTERLAALCQQDHVVSFDTLSQQVSVVHRCMNSLVDLCR